MCTVDKFSDTPFEHTGYAKLPLLRDKGDQFPALRSQISFIPILGGDYMEKVSARGEAAISVTSDMPSWKFVDAVNGTHRLKRRLKSP